MTTGDEISCTAASAERICRKLRQHGVARLPGFASCSEIHAIMEEAELAVSRFANYRNPYGPCARFSLKPLPAHLSQSRDLVRGDHLNTLPADFTASKRLLSKDVLRRTIRAYLGPRGGFMEVVAFTKDCNPDETAVYGKLHYDRRHQLKMILYLNDVDETNGAFGCIPGSHRIGRRLFHHGWRRTLGLETRQPAEIERAAADVAEDDPKYHMVPCVLDRRPRTGSEDRRRLVVSGRAGTLVVFDTHLLHFGGFVRAPNKQRWTLKGHSFALAS